MSTCTPDAATLCRFTVVDWNSQFHTRVIEYDPRNLAQVECGSEDLNEFGVDTRNVGLTKKFGVPISKCALRKKNRSALRN